jgi:hypothetical protein
MTSKEHAEHNEEVFNYLKEKEEFADWALITAFYAAVHYVDSKIFPIKKIIAGHKTTFPTLDSYYLQSNAKSKHALRIKLIREKGLGISGEFKWLFDQRKTYQYHNKPVPNPSIFLEATAKKLEAIKDACQ